MDIPMNEIESINKKLTELQVHAGRTDGILETIGQTQKDIAEILRNQSMQSVKNDVYDAAIQKAEKFADKLSDKVADNRVKIATAIALTTVIVGAVVKIACS